MGDLQADTTITDPLPATWAPVATLAVELGARLPTIVARILARIAATVPAYGANGPPGDDLSTSVHSTLRATLAGLAEGRGPNASELTAGAQLGTRRAEQGLPIDALVAALTVGQDVLWHELTDAARRHGHANETALLVAAPTVWGWNRALIDAVVTAHTATRQAIEARAISARQRFVELLLGGDADDDPERLLLARTLGFDPAGDFVGTVVDRGAAPIDVLAAQARIDRAAGTHVMVARGARVWGVSQDGEPDTIASHARRLAPSLPIAVGSPRATLAGARSSLTDARLALTVTPPATTSRFDDQWLWATLAGARVRLAPLLATGVEVATLHPHLAEAVQAFADGGFSVSEASRRLGLHANTVGYRLDRWSELTGWNPRTFAGLSRSMAALHLPDLPAGA